jgi:hypothetical protein
METVVGIFRSRTDAARAFEQLIKSGIDRDRITILLPGASEEQIEAAVPTSDTESEGMGEALGGTVGGAIGAASGASLGAATASLFVPGVGPILAAGVFGAAVLGAGGALAGVAAGDALEHGLALGLPHDELYVYEDALRKGRSVLLVYAEDDQMAESARSALTRTGAESIDAAREDWWFGLRDAEGEKYKANGGDFTRDELSYRRGFEAALHPKLRGRSFEEANAELRKINEACESDSAFRAGYERGQAHQRTLEDKHRAQTKAAAVTRESTTK